MLTRQWFKRVCRACHARIKSSFCCGALVPSLRMIHVWLTRQWSKRVCRACHARNRSSFCCGVTPSCRPPTEHAHEGMPHPFQMETPRSARLLKPMGSVEFHKLGWPGMRGVRERKWNTSFKIHTQSFTSHLRSTPCQLNDLRNIRLVIDLC